MPLVAANSSSLFGLDEGQALIDNLKDNYPQLAQGLCPQPYSLATITAVCRALLIERVPLKAFRRIAEAMVALAPRQLDAAALVEAVRQEIGALIVQTIVPAKLALPVITLCVVSFALYSRYMRASMLDVINSDYVRTARAKGLPEWRVITRHVVRNALIPVVTVAALNLGGLLGGAGRGGPPGRPCAGSRRGKR